MKRAKRVRKLKRIVIKEELIAICDDWKRAGLLNHFLFWVQFFDQEIFESFIEEENDAWRRHTMGESFDTILEAAVTAGWVYGKSTAVLKKETMVNWSDSTLREILKDLVKMRFLRSRQTPEKKWDRTIQYRPNIAFIEATLRSKGYHLEGFAFSKIENAITESEDRTSGSETATPEPGGSYREETRGNKRRIPIALRAGLVYFHKVTEVKRETKPRIVKMWTNVCQKMGKRYWEKSGNKDQKLTKDQFITVGWRMVVKFALMGYAKSKWHHDQVRTQGSRPWSLEMLFTNQKDQIEKYYLEYFQIHAPHRKRDGTAPKRQVKGVVQCRGCKNTLVYTRENYESMEEQIKARNCEYCDAVGSLWLKQRLT